MISTLHFARSADGRAAALALFFINGAAFGTWASRIPAFKADLGLSEASLGLILLAAALGALTAFLFAGRISDQYGASRLSLWAALATLIFLLLLPYWPGAFGLAAGLFLFGGAAGVLDLSMNAYGTEVEARRKGRTMSLLHGLWSIGFAAGAGLGGIAARLAFSPEWHFPALSLIMAPLMVFAVVNTIHSTPKTTATRTPVITIPGKAILPVCILAALAFMIEGAIMDWTGVFVITELNSIESQGAIILMLFSIGMVATRLGGDWITDLLGIHLTLVLCGILTLLSLVAIGLAPNVITVMAAAPILAIGIALLAPLMFSAAGRQTQPGQAVAAVAMLGYTGLMMGPVLIGFIAELAGLRVAFILLAVSALWLIILARQVSRVAS